MRLGKRERLALNAAKARHKRVGPHVHIRSAWDMMEDFHLKGTRKPDWAGKSIKNQPSSVRSH